MKSKGLLNLPYEYVISEEIVKSASNLLNVGSGYLNSVTLEGLSRPSGSLKRLLGLGKEIWSDETADEFVKRLRDEWK